MLKIVSFFKKIIGTFEEWLLATSTADEEAVRKVGLMKTIALLGIVFLTLLGSFSFAQAEVLLFVLTS